MGFLAELKKEWPVIFTAPRIALTYAVGAAVVIWGITHWEYSSVMTSKDEEVKSKDEQLKTKDETIHLDMNQLKFVERQRDDYKEKLGGATPSEAKAQIEELEHRLRLLEPRIAEMAPRHLSDEQKQAIITNARHASATNFPLSISHDGNCADCDSYAAQISVAFHDAGGWNITQPFVLGVSSRSPKGVSVIIRGDVAQEEGNIVVRALNSAKIGFDTFSITDWLSRPPSVEIIVTSAVN